MAKKKDSSPADVLETTQANAELPIIPTVPTDPIAELKAEVETLPIKEQADPQLAQAMETVTALQASLAELQELHKAVIDELKAKHQAETDLLRENLAEHVTEINKLEASRQALIDPNAAPLVMLRQMIFEDEVSRYVLDPYRTGGTYILRPIGRK
jgi:FtsZ-binding cell division protein ZapB